MVWAPEGKISTEKYPRLLKKVFPTFSRGAEGLHAKFDLNLKTGTFFTQFQQYSKWYIHVAYIFPLLWPRFTLDLIENLGPFFKL